MFKLCYDNGLQAKPFKFINHFDDFELTEEYINDPANKDFLDIKMILMDSEEFKENGGQFERINFVNNQLWIEMEHMYFVCDNCSNKTIEYIKNNKSLGLAFIFREYSEISCWREQNIDVL